MDEDEFRRRLQDRCDYIVTAVRGLETAMWCYWPQKAPYGFPRDLLQDSIGLVLVQARGLAAFVRDNKPGEVNAR